MAYLNDPYGYDFGVALKAVSKPRAAGPSLRQFARHAERFGVECVYETASGYLGPEDLRTLKSKLAGLALRARKRLPEGEIRELHEDGFTVPEIANLTGKSQRYISSQIKGVS